MIRKGILKIVLHEVEEKRAHKVGFRGNESKKWILRII